MSLLPAIRSSFTVCRNHQNPWECCWACPDSRDHIRSSHSDRPWRFPSVSGTLLAREPPRRPFPCVLPLQREAWLLKTPERQTCQSYRKDTILVRNRTRCVFHKRKNIIAKVSDSIQYKVNNWNAIRDWSIVDMRAQWHTCFSTCKAIRCIRLLNLCIALNFKTTNSPR